MLLSFQQDSGADKWGTLGVGEAHNMKNARDKSEKLHKLDVKRRDNKHQVCFYCCIGRGFPFTHFRPQ